MSDAWGGPLSEGGPSPRLSGRSVLKRASLIRAEAVCARSASATHWQMPSGSQNTQKPRKSRFGGLVLGTPNDEPFGPPDSIRRRVGRASFSKGGATVARRLQITEHCKTRGLEGSEMLRANRKCLKREFRADLAQKWPSDRSFERQGLQFCRTKGLQGRRHCKTRGLDSSIS